MNGRQSELTGIKKLR